jgi:glutathione S-transferase
MYKLYERPGAGSAAVEALLSLLGAQFELVSVPRNPDKSIPDWFMAINPRGQVPALVLPDGTVMLESAAMMIHLADVHGEAGLAPDIKHKDRARYLQWMLFFASEVYPADLRMYYPERFSTDQNHAPGIKQKGLTDLDDGFDHFASALGNGPYVLGDKFSAVDIYAAMLCSWASDVPALFARHSNIKRHYGRVAERPQIRAAWKRNEMPLT